MLSQRPCGEGKHKKSSSSSTNTHTPPQILNLSTDYRRRTRRRTNSQREREGDGALLLNFVFLPKITTRRRRATKTRKWQDIGPSGGRRVLSQKQQWNCVSPEDIWVLSERSSVAHGGDGCCSYCYCWGMKESRDGRKV